MSEDLGYKNKKYLFFVNNKLAYQTNEYVYDLELIDYKNQILEIDYGYDYDELGKKQRRYYYDVKENKILEEMPFSISVDLGIDLIEVSYGFKEYYSSGKYGLMSADEVIIPCEYDGIGYLNVDLFKYMKTHGKELVLLEKDNQSILYNIKNSKTITTFNSKYISDYDYSTFIKYKYTENGYITTVVYNLLSEKSMTFDKDDVISIGSNYITCEKNNKKIYYNTDFKEIYEES